jgi:hypothetical protein
MIRSGRIVILPFIACYPVFAQHSTGANINFGTISSFNRSVDNYLIGFEKNIGCWYRYEPKKGAFGLQSTVSFNSKNYVFRFAQQSAIVLKQNLVDFGIAATLNLKHNGARFIAGFNTGLLTYSQTSTRYADGNRTYSYSDNELDKLQHSNKFQVDICLEADQPIGPKQKFMVGLMLTQNVNQILSADFTYSYHDNAGQISYLHVSSNLYPLTASIVFRYKIK